MTEKDAEKKLQNLGERVRSGWKSTHKVSDQTRDAVRRAVTEDWEKSRNQAASRSKKETNQGHSGQTPKDKGTDHSQGH